MRLIFADGKNEMHLYRESECRARDITGEEGKRVAISNFLISQRGCHRPGEGNNKRGVRAHAGK